MSHVTPASPDKQKGKRNRWIDALLILVIIASLAFAGYSFANKDKPVVDLPEVVPTSVPPEKVTTGAPAIEGSNFGAEKRRIEAQKKAAEEAKKNGSSTTGDSTTNDVTQTDGTPEQVMETVPGPEVEIPAFGREEEGREGIETNEQTTRGTTGQRITPAMQKACPKIANGTICMPTLDRRVVYYHDVGTHYYKNALNMSIPSTRTAGRLDTSAQVGADHGTTLFAAHVVFKGGVKGPFYGIDRLRAGDDIIVRDMKGNNYLYRVYKKQVVPWEGLTKIDELYQKDGRPEIALITCSDYRNGHHTKRNIIWAVPVK